MTRYPTPGTALRNIARHNGWDLEELAGKLDYTPYLTQKLLDDEVPMTADVAGELADKVGEPLEHWLALYVRSREVTMPSRTDPA